MLQEEFTCCQERGSCCGYIVEQKDIPILYSGYVEDSKRSSFSSSIAATALVFGRDCLCSGKNFGAIYEW